MWVSKTDLTTYLRCPYAFWLLHEGVITREQLTDEFQRHLLDDGIAFQDRIEAELPTTAGDLPALLAGNAAVFDTPLFENPRLKIYGRPDGIDPAGGMAAPIEIKAHKDVQLSDKLELAFYWLLLERQRKHASEPRGVLFLRRAGAVVRVDVPLAPHHFERVRELLDEIRQARDHGVRPRVCGCNVCSRVVPKRVFREVTRNDDVTLLWGVSLRRARALERAGVGTRTQLMKTDASDLAVRMRGRRHWVSVGQVEKWQHHARAYATRNAVFFGRAMPVGTRFIALDLEYRQGPNGLLWLIGGCIVDGRERTPFSFWADSPRQERLALKKLTALLDRHRAPLVTWNGCSADIPNLRHASHRAGVEHLPGMLERHIDLFRYVADSFRFPLPGLGLKELARYFGIPRVSTIMDGLDALTQYEEYRRTRSTHKKRQLRAKLEEYNREDVESLVVVVDKLRHLAASLPKLPQAAQTQGPAGSYSRATPSPKQPAVVGTCGRCGAPVRRGRTKCGCGWLLVNDPFDVLTRDDILDEQRVAIELELQAVAQTGPRKSGEDAEAYSHRVEQKLRSIVLAHQ
jgi:predicted RecB family nuclease